MQYEQNRSNNRGAAVHADDPDVLVVNDTADADGEPSLGQLFADLSRETSVLVRKEVALAKTEMSQIATDAGKYVAFMLVGGLLAYAGLLAILAGIIVILGWAIDWWVAALLVGLLTAAIGGGLAKHGLDQLQRMDFKPEETIESLKEDKEWLKQQI